MNQRIIRIIAIVIILISCFVSGFSAGYIIKCYRKLSQNQYFIRIVLASEIIVGHGARYGDETPTRYG